MKIAALAAAAIIAAIAGPAPAGDDRAPPRSLTTIASPCYPWEATPTGATKLCKEFGQEKMKWAALFYFLLGPGTYDRPIIIGKFRARTACEMHAENRTALAFGLLDIDNQKQPSYTVIYFSLNYSVSQWQSLFVELQNTNLDVFTSAITMNYSMELYNSTIAPAIMPVIGDAIGSHVRSYE